MTNLQVHLVHVGPMNNMGTQALILSDISVVTEILKGNVNFSVSTSDVDGVKRLNANLDSVLPPFVDIPYQKADELARDFGFKRYSLKYKAFALVLLFSMLAEAALSIVSIGLEKCGLTPFYRADAIRSIRRCDFVVSYSDENFKEGASLLPLNLSWLLSWWSMLVSRTWEILVAKSFGKRVVMFPNSIGPFRTWVGRWLSKLALGSCDFVLIRDPVSYDIACSLGIESQKILTADTALLFSSASRISLDNSSGPRVGVSPGIYAQSLSKEEIHRYVLSHGLALDAAIERYGFRVYLLPHFVSGFPDDDLETSRLILAEMKNKDRVEIVYSKNVGDFKAFMDQMDMVISSKMHPAVFAASGYTPVLCIAYDQKQTGFFRLLGMNDCVLDIRRLSYRALSAKIDHVWQNRAEIADSLRKQIPVLQEGVRTATKEAITSLSRNL